ncbi:MAG: PadR family transcriptional regulator [Sphingomonadales bacterium]
MGGRGGGRHGWGHAGRSGGRRRMFEGSELRLVLLKLIADQPRHGYDLIRAIEELTGGAYAPSPGVVYPSITMLQDMGHIAETDTTGTRKAFSVTDDGTAYLAERATEVAELLARLEALAKERGRTDGVPIRRAMGNLRTVLEQRLSRDDTDTELMHRTAALLDEVAQKIERL